MLTVRVTGRELKALVEALHAANEEEVCCILADEAQNTITIDEVKHQIKVSIKCELERFAN